MSRETRYRNWVSILYPESAKDNWLDILKEQHVQAIISPLHDSDITAQGEPKKAHFHIMLCFNGVKTIKQAQDVFDSIGAIHCQSTNDTRAMLRYFCHLDDYEKAQYSTADVISLGGIDFNALITSSSDKYKAVREMIQFCKNERIRAYSDLLEYSSIHRDDWFRALCDSSTVVMKEYLKSEKWKIDNSISWSANKDLNRE